MPNPQANSKKKLAKVFWRAGKPKIPLLFTQDSNLISTRSESEIPCSGPNQV